MNPIVEEIELLYSRWGTHNYDERLSQSEHAVQCAQFAIENGADNELVVAALLHDVGHILTLEQKVGSVNLDTNDSHEATGAAYLAPNFSSHVTAPIALHVEAKRYLCTVESDYFASLSAGSVRSLELQGGLMTKAEVERFENHPAAQRAIALRRWDEAGKILEPSGVTFSSFRERIISALRSS